MDGLDRISNWPIIRPLNTNPHTEESDILAFGIKFNSRISGTFLILTLLLIIRRVSTLERHANRTTILMSERNVFFYCHDNWQNQDV